MSHHFTAEFAVIPPGKEPTSNKLKRNNESVSAKRREAKKLDIDNKQMEWKLQQLKVVMAKEKEDREKQGYIWKSGSIEKHSRNILGRTVSASAVSNETKKSPHPPPTSKSAKTKKKIQVLKDEPLDLPKRPSASKNLRKALLTDNPDVNLPVTNGNGSSPPKPNQEEWISVAPEKGSDDIMDMQSDIDGNIPLENIRTINPAAVGLYFLRWGRKRLLMSVDGVIRKPKGGWDTEVYFPYVAKLTNEMQMRPEPPPLSHRKSPRKPQTSRSSYSYQEEEETGGKLLEGSYDEDANRRGFQQAVSQWRNNSGAGGDMNTDQVTTHRSTPEMSVHAVQATPPKTEIKFVEEASLTYMEKVLLNKHRKTDIPALRGTGNLLHDLNSILSGEDLEQYRNKENMEPELLFTEEEEDERESYRQLFTPTTSHTVKSHPEETSSVIAITEVDDDVQYDDEESVCIVEVEPDRKSTSHNANEVKISEEFLIKNEQSIEAVLPATSTQLVQQRSYRAPHKSNVKSASMPNVDTKPSPTEDSKKKQSSNVSHFSTAEDTSIVQAISELPLNPDAHYTRGLNDFFVWSEARNSNSDFINHQPEKITKAKVTKGTEAWNPIESFVNRSTSTSRTSSFVSEDFQHEFKTESLGTEEVDRCDSNSTTEDNEAINKLEWELASQAGNVTADGRISRLIDEWSDDDLGIIEDTGTGSGLSTPDITTDSLPQSAMNTIRIESMQNDFQKMEQVMLDDLSDEYSDNEF